MIYYWFICIFIKVCSAGGGVYGQRLPPRPSSAVFREAQKFVKARLEKKWLPMFQETPEFKQRNLSTRRGDNRKISVQSPAGNKVNRKQILWSIPTVYDCQGGELNWMTNSLDAILFRRALQDHTTCANFIQYLGIKEEPEQFLVNNVLFWLEVQRFKACTKPKYCNMHLHIPYSRKVWQIWQIISDLPS